MDLGGPSFRQCCRESESGFGALALASVLTCLKRKLATQILSRVLLYGGRVLTQRDVVFVPFLLSRYTEFICTVTGGNCVR